MSAYIFDCDGTLIDSYGAIVERLYLAYRAFGVEFTRERIRRAILETDTVTFNRGVCEEAGLDENAFYEAMKSIPEEYTRMTLMPHCRELLEELKAAGIKTFVFTHRGPATEDIFESLGIRDYFEEIITSANGFKRKPDGEGVRYLVEKYGLDPDEVYYVGDRQLDIECGRNAGVHTVFVRTEGLALDSGRADFVIDDLAELFQSLISCKISRVATNGGDGYTKTALLKEGGKYYIYEEKNYQNQPRTEQKVPVSKNAADAVLAEFKAQNFADCQDERGMMLCGGRFEIRYWQNGQAVTLTSDTLPPQGVRGIRTVAEAMAQFLQ